MTADFTAKHTAPSEFEQDYKIAIIGAGFSGICLGIQLKRAYIHDFVILEEAQEVGGTWRENTYPGAECDIPSALYSYSFEHNAEWKFKWSEQSQILDYQKNVAAKYGLYQYIVFREHVVAAEYFASVGLWQLRTTQGNVYNCQHIVSAIGQLHRPSVPEFADAAAFKGPVFHSAQWDHSVDLRGKRVGVIGNAASAVQFIPPVAQQAAHVTVFQRSANWVVPKPDRPYTRFEQWVSDRLPLITKLYRLRIWLRSEWLLFPAMRGNKVARYLLQKQCEQMLKRHIKDEELRRILTPDYPAGAKRLLFSDNYYAALARGNVRLETAGVERFTESGVLRKDGVAEPFDIIIYGTGFKTNPFLESINVIGRDGTSLRDAWNDGAHAYLGINTHGFPNLHMLYGPNTNLGHNSIILMIEAQSKYIVQSVLGLDRRAARTLEIKADVETEYNEELQARLRSMVFTQVSDSWYMDHGKVTNNWAGSAFEYVRRLRKIDWGGYEVW